MNNTVESCENCGESFRCEDGNASRSGKWAPFRCDRYWFADSQMKISLLNYGVARMLLYPRTTEPKQ